LGQSIGQRRLSLGLYVGDDDEIVAAITRHNTAGADVFQQRATAEQLVAA
jgi:hypothetical protein